MMMINTSISTVP